jgi:hypothetical protein
MGEITYIGDTSTKLLWGPRRFLLIHWMMQLINEKHRSGELLEIAVMAKAAQDLGCLSAG